MSEVHFRFYEELNDFLPPNRRKRDFTIPFRPQNSIKDMIESVGVPHTEVDLILVDGKSVDFSYIVCPGDRSRALASIAAASASRSTSRQRPVTVKFSSARP